MMAKFFSNHARIAVGCYTLVLFFLSLHPLVAAIPAGGSTAYSAVNDLTSEVTAALSSAPSPASSTTFLGRVWNGIKAPFRSTERQGAALPCDAAQPGCFRFGSGAKEQSADVLSKSSSSTRLEDGLQMPVSAHTEELNHKVAVYERILSPESFPRASIDGGVDALSPVSSPRASIDGGVERVGRVERDILKHATVLERVVAASAGDGGTKSPQYGSWTKYGVENVVEATKLFRKLDAELARAAELTRTDGGSARKGYVTSSDLVVSQKTLYDAMTRLGRLEWCRHQLDIRLHWFKEVQNKASGRVQDIAEGGIQGGLPAAIKAVNDAKEELDKLARLVEGETAMRSALVSELWNRLAVPPFSAPKQGWSRFFGANWLRPGLGSSARPAEQTVKLATVRDEISSDLNLIAKQGAPANFRLAVQSRIAVPPQIAEAEAREAKGMADSAAAAVSARGQKGRGGFMRKIMPGFRGGRGRAAPSPTPAAKAEDETSTAAPEIQRTGETPL